MRASIILDRESEKELEELSLLEKTSKSQLIREAVREKYLKEIRAKNNLSMFIDLYLQGVVTKDLLFLLLPRKDAEAIIIGAETGKEAAQVAKHLGG